MKIKRYGFTRPKTTTVRNAFTGHPGKYRACWDHYWQAARVWDSVAREWTLLHALTPRQVARVRRLCGEDKPCPPTN